MSKTPRPTLDSLADRFARKDAPAGAAASPSPSKGEFASSPAASSSAPSDAGEPEGQGKAGGRVQILTRIDAPTRKRLRMIALEQDRTVQDICEEAIRDFVARHSK